MAYKLMVGGVLRLADNASIPAEPRNSDYQVYLAWVAAGNIPQPADPAPPPKTVEQRIDEAFPHTDVARVIFEALFELANDVRALRSQAPITRAQLRDWLKAKLPA